MVIINIKEASDSVQLAAAKKLEDEVIIRLLVGASLTCETRLN